MNARFFLDTNVFVYSFDAAHRAKQRRARTIIRKALETGSGVVSTQVIQEFLNVATRKFDPPMQNAECRLYLEAVLEPLCEVYSNPSLFRRALDLSAETAFSFYDSLIVAGALEGACDLLLTEDLQDGRTIRGLVIRNPFLAGPSPI
jgi:predicted nucleic acid-binding protein